MFIETLSENVFRVMTTQRQINMTILQQVEPKLQPQTQVGTTAYCNIFYCPYG